jgi:AraC-like DNA-binding protein
VFGIKFRPGGFYPFLKQPIVQLTDTSISFRDAFGVDGTALERAILATEDKAALIQLVEDFLFQHLPEQDQTVAQINRIVDCVSADRTITRVDDIADRMNLNKRTLQRLFRQYVGVSPKWVIKYYRLHDAADQLANSDTPDLSALAVNLGYFDQAHFIKDFKAMVGSTPLEYAKMAGA